MTDRKLSRAHVGLALASALVVLLASAVAVSRIGEDDERPVATGPGSTSPSDGAVAPSAASDAGANGTSGSASVGSERSPGAGGQAGAADALAAGAQSASVTRPAAERLAAPESDSGTEAQAAGGGSSAAAGSSASDGSHTGSSSAPDGSSGTDSGSNGGGGSSGAGSQPPGGASGGDDGQQPPGPRQDEPEDKALVAASVSAGEGAQGGVVGVSLSGTTPEVDVTLGTSPVIGDHPPSEGTGVDVGGRLFHQASPVPAFVG